MAALTNRDKLFGSAQGEGMGARDHAALTILCQLIANEETPHIVAQRGREELTGQMQALVARAFMYADAFVAQSGVVT